jgi:hypothetical protein
MLAHSSQEVEEQKHSEVGRLRVLKPATMPSKPRRNTNTAAPKIFPHKPKGRLLIQVKFASSPHPAGEEKVIQCNNPDPLQAEADSNPLMSTIPPSVNQNPDSILHISVGQYLGRPQGNVLAA